MKIREKNKWKESEQNNRQDQHFITILLSFRIYVCGQINRSTSKKDDFVNAFVLILMILLMLIL